MPSVSFEPGQKSALSQECRETPVVTNTTLQNSLTTVRAYHTHFLQHDKNLYSKWLLMQ